MHEQQQTHEKEQRGHTIRWGDAGFAWLGSAEDATLESDADALAKLSVAADEAHRIMTGEGVTITEVDGTKTNIPINPPDHPDPKRIQSLLNNPDSLSEQR